MGTQQYASQDSQEIKLSCKNLWKVFGPNPQKFMAKHKQNPPSEAFIKTNHIGAVKNASFDVHPGEIFVIMGLSGSGKSTLVRCLSRLHKPTTGNIFFEGQDLSKVREKALIQLRRHKMGMVFQHFGLLPHRNVLENIAFPLEVQGIDRKQRKQRAMEVIDLVGLNDRVENLPMELSGGEQQRVGIARSLVVEPEVWFLDEPFSALDPLIRAEMQDEFLRLQRMLHKTIIFITHDFLEAIRVADKIAIMKDGEIVQIGTPEELITEPADSYVGEFTKKVPRGKVISVKAVMDEISEAEFSSLEKQGKAVMSDIPIEKCARQVLTQEPPVCVTDECGETFGMIEKEKFIDTLFEDSKPHSETEYVN